MKTNVFHVPVDRAPYVVDDDGTEYDLDSPEGQQLASDCGVSVEFLSGEPIGNTPIQNHNADPCVVDPRPIRSLTAAQKRAFMHFASVEAYAAVAGFETWRGQDRWIYVDVLGVGRDSDEAESMGMPVGPITPAWIQNLRMVGDQLALRLLDPKGYTATSTRDYGGSK